MQRLCPTIGVLGRVGLYPREKDRPPSHTTCEDMTIFFFNCFSCAEEGSIVSEFKEYNSLLSGGCECPILTGVVRRL